MMTDMDRRTFIKAIALGLGALALRSYAGAASPPTRPNVIWILADDLGSGDLGCYGCKDIPTPYIDSLAKTGVKCTSFYAAAPMCTPSRACLLSGRYPEATGMTTVLMGEGGMSSSVVTVAELLKAAGYATGLVGKWHLGYNGKSLPNKQGFDEFYGHRGGKVDFFKHTDDAQKIAGDPLGKHDFYENEKEIFPEGYTTDLFTARAIRFVEEHRQQPFFLFLAYNAPHYARQGVLQAPDEYVRRFAKGPKPTMRELYTAMVSCLDDGVGKLLACLKQNGLDENTLVVFMSDNGADPAHGGSNRPLTGAKRNWTEGGIRVPMLARWPGHLPPGTTTAESLHMIDLLPTTLAVAGVTKPAGLPLDGLDVFESLQGQAKLPERPLFFGQKVVRRGKWKRIDAKLYDLENDPREKQDLASQHPETLKELEQLTPPWRSTRH